MLVSNLGPGINETGYPSCIDCYYHTVILAPFLSSAAPLARSYCTSPDMRDSDEVPTLVEGMVVCYIGDGMAPPTPPWCPIAPITDMVEEAE